MTEHDSELLQRLVVGSKRNGRRRYDKQAKAALVQACLKSGVSVARVALEHGINANLLRKWIPAPAQARTISWCAFAASVRTGRADGLLRQADRVWVTRTAAKRHRDFSEWA